MPALAWILLAVGVLALLLFDLKGHRHEGAQPTLRSAAWWSAGWTALGLAFTGVLVVISDRDAAAGEYLQGFLIEKSLSLDNLFVFAVLLGYFSVPIASQRRVLIWGIAGAIVLRAIFILVGAAALDAFHATIYVFGAFLVLTAIKLARQGDDHDVDVEHTLAMRTLKRVIPVGAYDGDSFFTKAKDTGQRIATPLFACLVMVAAFDVLFAVDSVPAIFAISRDTYVVFAANAFSLLGMTSLYFLLKGMMDRFHFLNLGLAVILAFVGVKMLLTDVWHMPSWLSFAVIIGTLAVAVAASLARPRETHGLAATADEAPGPRSDDEPELVESP
jgi:tellurite resistance protein TerC